MGLLERLFDSNERDIARLRKLVAGVNNFEAQVKAMSADQMRARIDAVRQEFHSIIEKHGNPSPQLEDAQKKHIPEVFALCREASVRTIGLRNYDVQMIASIALHEGRIAEQKTGEGKTLTAVPALVLNGLTGRGSHLITVNDYLARHGAEWMGPIYRYLGMSLAVLQHSTPTRERQHVYSQEVLYGTNNEFGFDYLRDNMVIHAKDMVQGELNFGIVDECDSILIDEARTPLIISGSSNEDTSLYNRVDKVIKRLKGMDITGQDKPKDIFEQAFSKKIDADAGKEWDYEFDRKNHSASLTPRGIARVEKELDDLLTYDPNDEEPGKNLFSYVNTEVSHFVQQALRAISLYQNEVQYVVKDGHVIIVDEFTGRLMFGRRYSDGLHQAIEAKEGLEVAPESQTLATITIQNYFRIYHKLAGMTGTAKTEEEEFKKIYGMDVVVVPTNRTVARKDVGDVVYKTERAKYNAIVEDVAERQQKKQPVLVGTVSIEKSERLADLMRKRGVTVNVLNAKYHEMEANIVAQAGRPAAVTIATNMAGRGTDIVLGGNAEYAAREQLRGQGIDPDDNDELLRGLIAKLKPEYEANKDVVISAGGLYVLGSERHESRRIDNQLRGRSGRQGDPGESRFFLSLEDDLMKMYGGERVSKLMEFLKIEEEMPIESGMLTRAIENAQKKVEGRNFDIRKHLLQFDDVINKQRTVIYDERRRILLGGDLKEQTLGFIANAVKRVVERNTMGSGRNVEVDYEALVAEARTSFPVGDITAESIAGKLPDEIAALMSAKATDLYERKEEEVGRAVLMRLNPEAPPEFVEANAKAAGALQMREIERVITLRAIDEQWIDHLNMLDQLRSGVSLRGYGQQDPVVVFAQEGFAEFEKLKDEIQLDVIRKAFMVRIEAPPVERKSAYNIQQAIHPSAQQDAAAAPGPASRALRRARGMGPSAAAPTGAATATEARTAPKLGRNVKCYCGSGKKYKQCHLAEDGGNPPDNWPAMYEKAYGEAAPVE